MRAIFVSFLLIATSLGSAYADEAKKPEQPVAVIYQADINDLQNILQREVPPVWAQPFAQWVNKLIARQKPADEKK